MSNRPLGGILLLGALTILWGGNWPAMKLTKANRWTIPTAALTGWQLVLGAVPITLGAAVRYAGSGDAGPLSRLGSLSSGALLGTAYATLVGVIFCHWAWFRLVAILPAAVAAIGTLGIPIVGLFTSALVLGEPVGSAEVVALGLVVAGLGILVRGLTADTPESLPGYRAVSRARRESR